MSRRLEMIDVLKKKRNELKLDITNIKQVLEVINHQIYNLEQEELNKNQHKLEL